VADAGLRQLPAVHQLVEEPSLAAVMETHGREAVVDAARAALADARARLLAGGECSRQLLVDEALARLAARPRLRSVINATGVLLHTNLGRAPLASAAAAAVAQAAAGYVNLELDLATGKRSNRQAAVRGLLCGLLGAEAATVVNNCAAATVLTLRALAAGREVIVARGQLVEIGGGFRIPDILATSGATLREVGTTNITRIGDYAAAIGPQTALLMRIHTSNFRVRGFTAAATLDEMVALGRKHAIRVVDDIGSGALADYSRYGLTGEPLARESLAAGADLVMFSADKLLGGPQAGVIAGRSDLVAAVERDPLFRAMRPCKLTLAGLATTLELYRAGRLGEIPVLRQLDTTVDELRRRAAAVADAVGGTVRDDVTFVGGGSLPDQPLPTVVVALTGPAEPLAVRLRNGEPAVLARIRDDELLIDLRSVLPEQLDDLARAVRAARE
jgi:L-seryl-tRNA(Ser) seleniumtransferase